MKISIIDEMKPSIDKTIEKLGKVSFKNDPIVEKEFSKIFSLVGSSQKRHGTIIENAICEALKKHKNYEVWSEPKFKISSRVNHMTTNVNNNKKNPDWIDLLDNNLDYGDSERTQQVDVVAYDKNRKLITALEVKRGYSHHDAGKKKKILQEILATKLLIKSYGKKLGFEVEQGKAFICSYYGANEFSHLVEISKDGLDELFQVEIYEAVEEVNHYYRKRIRELGINWMASFK